MASRTLSTATKTKMENSLQKYILMSRSEMTFKNGIGSTPIPISLDFPNIRHRRTFSPFPVLASAIWGCASRSLTQIRSAQWPVFVRENLTIASMIFWEIQYVIRWLERFLQEHTRLMETGGFPLR